MVAVSYTHLDVYKRQEPLAVAYHGNIVDLLEYAIDQNIKIDLLSDQTSCHEAYTGGYCPQGLTFEMRTKMLDEYPNAFRTLVDRSLARHFEAVKTLTHRGTYFLSLIHIFIYESNM